MVDDCIKKKASLLGIFILPIFFVFCLNSCETINPEEEIPSYITIEKILLSTDSATQGSNASNITDAWVYVDNDFIGTYELPSTIPVLKSGAHTLMVRGGIQINGVGDNRTAYPFYTPYEQTINLIKQTPVKINPAIKYDPAVNFPWMEDFEKTSISLIKTNRSDTSIGITHDITQVYEGKNSGVIYLDNTHTFGEVISNNNFVLPHNGKPVFLEINYKTNFKFMVGINANTNQQVTSYPIGGGNPTSTWKKLYLELTTAVSSSTDADSYSIYIGMMGDGSIPSPTLYLDNIKLVYL